MKKIIAALLAMAMILCLAACGEKEPELTGLKVTVEICSEGELSIIRQVVAQDVDGDGKTTIDEALYSAHEQYFEGGAEKGYASSETEYGVSLTKLWGVENGVSGYGYYVNNASPQSLLDEIKEGDFIAAYSFADLTGWSDVYTFYDKAVYDAQDGKVVLTLNSMSFDENWNPVSSALEGAVVLVDGKKTDVLTGSDGTAEICVSGKGEHTVSVSFDGMRIVPAAAIVNVN